MNEDWRPIKGFEGLYEVSNFGNVRSMPWLQKHSSSGKMFQKKSRRIAIRFGSSFNGYSSVSLTYSGHQKSFFIHRIIAQAFIPNPENKDNRVENLEWCTRSENAKHSFSIGLQCNKGEKHPGHKLTDQDVLNIRSRYSSGESSYLIYKTTPNISYTTIKDVIAKRIWAHI